MRRRAPAGFAARATAVAAFALLAAACEDAAGPVGGVRGTWTLTEADGAPLPAVVFDDTANYGGARVPLKATVLSGELELRAATYRETLTIDLVVDGNPLGAEETTITGSYTADEPFLSFDPDRGDLPAYSGTLEADALTTVETQPTFGSVALRWEM